MTLSELADFICDLVEEQFPEASVVWAEQYSAEWKLPQVTLKMKDMEMPRHPVNIVKDGMIKAYYESSKILEVNRYANSVSGGDGELSTPQNPAVDDLSSLLFFMQSEAGVERQFAANVCIEAMGPVRDLSEVDRTHYRYRAMQEYTVRFMLEYANGDSEVHVPAGRENWEPNKEPIGYFEEVETEETYE